MLREVSHVSLSPQEGPRRCFADERMHLLVWYEDDGKIRGFELTYESGKGLRVVRWLPNDGFLHARLEDDAAHRFLDASAILISCGASASADLSESSRGQRGSPGGGTRFVAAQLTRRIAC